MRVTSPEARSFYEVECARAAWSVRELKRQIDSMLFERLSRSRDEVQVLEEIAAQLEEKLLEPVDEGLFEIVLQPATRLGQTHELQYVGILHQLRVDGVESILHLEIQVDHRDALPVRTLAYNALLRQRHPTLPVLSIVVYLMHEAPPHPVPRGIVPSVADPQLAFSYETRC